jgi:hypothetical protein
MGRDKACTRNMTSVQIFFDKCQYCMLPYGSRNGTRSAEKRVMKYGHSLQVKAMQVQDSPLKETSQPNRAEP